MRIAPIRFCRRWAPTDAEIGWAGERFAARRLPSAGLRLLGRRVATPHGEIDLVALDGERLVCVEVKTSLRSRGGAYDPGDRWRRDAHSRQRRAAESLARQGLGAADLAPRLDLIEVWIGEGPAAPRWRHSVGISARARRTWG